jgi:Ca2+-binding EF-hand superfamily protein
MKGGDIMEISEIGQSMSFLSLVGTQQQPSASNIASSIMDKLDTNDDGVLSTEEIGKSKKNGQKILEADTNEDGTVTLDELLSDISKNMGNMPPMMQQPDASGIAKHILDELDTNGDGVLSSDEISKGGKRAQRILGADADGDGTVTMDELVSDISKKQGKMKQSGQAGQGVFDLTSMALSSYKDAQSLLDAVQNTNLAMVA